MSVAGSPTAAFARFRRLMRFAAASMTVGALGTAYYYRPHTDDEIDLSGKRKKVHDVWSAPRPLIDMADQDEPRLMKFARFLAISTVAALSRLYLLSLNDMAIKQDEKWHNLIKQVQSREKGTALITVSNHCTTLDDPAIFGALVPWSVNLTPEQVRWSICSQDICFSNPLFSTFFGAGKTLPINRGAGLDQRLLLDLGRRVAQGQWVHVFPEGKCSQTGRMGGREGERGELLGRLKWGVGKLIARSPTKPIVIPIYHTGMDHFLPIDPVAKRLPTWQPGTGLAMGLVVGDPVPLDDLLDQYQAQFPSTRRLRTGFPEAEEEAELEGWRSSEAERKIFSAIARRIESAMVELEEVAHQHHLAAHGKPVRGYWDVFYEQLEKQQKEGAAGGEQHSTQAPSAGVQIATAAASSLPGKSK